MNKYLPVLQMMSVSSRPLSEEEAKTDCSYCRAPCCQLIVELRPDEVDRFESENYQFESGIRKVLKRRSDGYCVYYVPGSGCSTYEDRPAVCPSYSCREDRRITPSLKYGKNRFSE